MITWKVEGFTTVSNGTHTDIVKNVQFHIKYEKDGKYAETRGNKDVAYNPDSFTKYSDITEEQAVTWAKNVLGAEKIAALEKLVTDCYENMDEDTISAFVYTNDSLTATEKTLEELPF